MLLAGSCARFPGVEDSGEYTVGRHFILVNDVPNDLKLVKLGNTFG